MPTIVIPTLAERITTVATIPEHCEYEVVIADQEGLNVARNAGIRQADDGWIVLVDDDISFPHPLTAEIIERMDRTDLLGIRGEDPVGYVKGRYVIFHTSLWKRVDGFDESREHGGDTDFAIRCEKAGATIHTIPEWLVPHHDEASVFSLMEHLDWLAYLWRRHPRKMTVPAMVLFLQKLS